jgi:hypothetical protein
MSDDKLIAFIFGVLSLVLQASADHKPTVTNNYNVQLNTVIVQPPQQQPCGWCR